MKVIGEVMVIGCLWEEVFLKVVCFLEIGVDYLLFEEVENVDEVILECKICFLEDDCLFFLVVVLCWG